MLADNRDVIADILAGLAVRLPWDDEASDARAMRMFDGAATLRELHEFETVAWGDEIDELERLRELVNDLDELLKHPPMGVRGAVKLGDQVKAIRERLAQVTG